MSNESENRKGSHSPEPDQEGHARRHRWIGAPDWDQSPDAQFRRDVAELLEEVEARFGIGSSAARGGANLEPDPAESFDVRAGTPYLLVTAARALNRRLRSPTRKGDGDPGHWDPGHGLVILELARAGRSTPGHLRRQLGLPASTVTTIVRRCERDGLIARRGHPHDGRSSVLILTPAGRRTAVALVRSWRAADEAFLGRLKPAERDELRRLLRKAVRGLAQ